MPPETPPRDPIALESLDTITRIMPELPLDDDERNAFVSHLHRVRMPELVGANRRLTPAAAAA